MDASLIDRHAPDPACLNRPSWMEAEEAVRTLIRWAGDDPTRVGLLDTPKRVLRAYQEWFAGYENDPTQLLARCFEEVAGYDEIVLLRDVSFQSHCEHHMAPIIGRYSLPAEQAGISNWCDWCGFFPNDCRSKRDRPQR